jgi:hypothetical protein
MVEQTKLIFHKGMNCLNIVYVYNVERDTGRALKFTDYFGMSILQQMEAASVTNISTMNQSVAVCVVNHTQSSTLWYCSSIRAVGLQKFELETIFKHICDGRIMYCRPRRI